MRKHLDYNIYVMLSALQPNTLRRSLDGAIVDWESTMAGSTISSRSARGDLQTWAGNGLPPIELSRTRTTNSPIVILNSTWKSGIIGSKNEIVL
jgi:hypothetical protein